MLRWSSLERAGILLRFVAVVLDAVIVLFPLQIVIGLLYGGGYVERGNGRRWLESRSRESRP